MERLVALLGLRFLDLRARDRRFLDLRDFLRLRRGRLDFRVLRFAIFTFTRTKKSKHQVKHGARLLERN